MPNVIIAFNDLFFTRGKDLLDKVEELNREVNRSKPSIIIFVLPMDFKFCDNLWFNENIFLHLVMHNEKMNCISFDRDFHYLGSKNTKKIISLIREALN